METAVSSKQTAVRSTIRSFKDLTTWQTAHQLVIAIYTITKIFPKDEIFGLTNQLRRAIISVTSNIAEGFSRQHPKEKIQFYYQSLSSLTEVQSQLLAARDIGYITKELFSILDPQTIQVSKMLNSLIKKIKHEDIGR